MWPLYPSWDIFAADADGGHLTRLTDNDAYDAECAISPDGRRIVFTSLREGDLDLYMMDADGRNVRRLTDEPGYDGGAVLLLGRPLHRLPRLAARRAGRSWRSYRALLGRGLVRPRRLDIYLMNADGTGLRRVTRLAGANFAPFMHPNGRQIVFSSNLHDPSGRSFALYLVNVDGSGLERVTWADGFASFPDVHARRPPAGVLRQPRRRRRRATSTSSSPTGAADGRARGSALRNHALPRSRAMPSESSHATPSQTIATITIPNTVGAHHIQSQRLRSVRPGTPKCSRT